ncbi:sortase domain-bontaining protein [Thermorudis peleae]|uniref:sortase domain-containing protein n=1 Tax=Thermorudis peleae TaxID=1382356 RepID=UPI000571430A|nr:sortase [Thermorudis peleae]
MARSWLAQLALGSVFAWLVGMFAGYGGAHLAHVLSPAQTPTPRPAAVSVRLPTPTPSQPTVPPSPTPNRGVPIARVLIPDIGVNAPVETRSLTPQREMEAPSGPSVVAWYAFSALPDSGGNIVLAGHVDYAGVGPAVFWNLWKLPLGAPVTLQLVDGRLVHYRVSARWVVDEHNAPVDQILGATPQETVTLITCAGNYNPETGRYDQRLIIRAERVAPTRS